VRRRPRVEQLLRASRYFEDGRKPLRRLTPDAMRPAFAIADPGDITASLSLLVSIGVDRLLFSQVQLVAVFTAGVCWRFSYGSSTRLWPRYASTPKTISASGII
jgi:hypothetical protein